MGPFVPVARPWEVNVTQRNTIAVSSPPGGIESNTKIYLEKDSDTKISQKDAQEAFAHWSFIVSPPEPGKKQGCN